MILKSPFLVAQMQFSYQVLMKYIHQNEKNIKYLRASIELSSALCGLKRTGHFDGVCTVVYRLLTLIKPKKSIFRRKRLATVINFEEPYFRKETKYTY